MQIQLLVPGEVEFVVYTTEAHGLQQLLQRREGLEPFKEPYEFLRELINFVGTSRSKKFIEKIRQYNCLFAFTSMGATIDRSINNGGGPNIFKISGQVCHRMGSLLPQEGDLPKFTELYTYHGGNEVNNRI